MADSSISLSLSVSPALLNWRPVKVLPLTGGGVCAGGVAGEAAAGDAVGGAGGGCASGVAWNDTIIIVCGACQVERR